MLASVAPVDEQTKLDPPSLSVNQGIPIYDTRIVLASVSEQLYGEAVV